MLKFTPIMPAFCLLLLHSYYANNFASKIDASLLGVSNQLSQEYNAPHPEVGVLGLRGRHENNEDCIATSQE